MAPPKDLRPAFNEKLDAARKTRARMSAVGTRSRRDAWDKRADVARARAEDNATRSKPNGGGAATPVQAPASPVKATPSTTTSTPAVTSPKKPSPKGPTPPKVTRPAKSAGEASNRDMSKESMASVKIAFSPGKKKAPTHEHYQGTPRPSTRKNTGSWRAKTTAGQQRDRRN